METSPDVLLTLTELLRANDLTAARAYIKKIFSSLDEDMRGKVLLAVYSAALLEIQEKQKQSEPSDKESK
jgi:hypothetical protein